MWTFFQSDPACEERMLSVCGSLVVDEYSNKGTHRKVSFTLSGESWGVRNGFIELVAHELDFRS